MTRARAFFLWTGNCSSDFSVQALRAVRAPDGEREPRAILALCNPAFFASDIVCNAIE